MPSAAISDADHTRGNFSQKYFRRLAMWRPRTLAADPLPPLPRPEGFGMSTTFTEIDPADAVKLFKDVTVQTAKPVKVKDADGVERPAFETANAPLAEEH